MRFRRIHGILFHNICILTSPGGVEIDLFKACWNRLLHFTSDLRAKQYTKTKLPTQSCFFMTSCTSEWLPAPAAETHWRQWTFFCTLQWWNIHPLISYCKWQYSCLPFSGTPTRVIWRFWLFVCLLAWWNYMILLPVRVQSQIHLTFKRTFKYLLTFTGCKY